MLLLAQTGSVKIGEVVRYTVTYTPSRDRILPSPERLHVRLRNTSSIALRAAFVHGPYTLCVAAYPASYNPNDKFANPRRYGVPCFEPMLKAGGSWECELVVPDDIRQAATTTTSDGGAGPSPSPSASWVVEVSSQVIFSSSAAVGYELLVARDQKSLNLSSAAPVVGGQAKLPQPGRLSDHQQQQQYLGVKSQLHGVFSKAVHIKVEDTAALWNSPALPEWTDAAGKRIVGALIPPPPAPGDRDRDQDQDLAMNAGAGPPPPRRQKKVHLVILTHGLHSNLGADMLFMKESVDAAARQAKIDARKRRAMKRAEAEAAATPQATGIETDENRSPRDDSSSSSSSSSSSTRGGDEGDGDDDDDDDDEEVIVRGYSGNATKTEKGIKYLGKRLARYVLSLTYPDQPVLPLGKGSIEGFKQGLGRYGHDFASAHRHSTSTAAGAGADDSHKRPYRITSISFIGHSLGGLVQTYAIAYIQKHSPTFFSAIKPINFIAMASPFLGLSNENPLYVKFALDFGLVGRTGQDLGLTWRAPTIARSGWGALVSNLGESAHKKVYGESRPESKPLLRILPTGPAHIALKKFRNRTVYSNVVNDGIVPLRTSCLLFLDWQGLGRVNKARRDAGLVETFVGFGWAELTGANSVPARQRLRIPAVGDGQLDDSGANTPVDGGHQVPLPSSDALAEDGRVSISSFSTAALAETTPDRLPLPNGGGGGGESAIQTPLTGFFNFFRSSEPQKEPPTSEKQKKILQRSQTLLKMDEAAAVAASSTTTTTTTTTTTSPSSEVNDVSAAAADLSPSRTTTTTTMTTITSTGKATSGHELENDPNGAVMVPPRTTFFESAGDLMNPKIPDVEYLLDPSKRPRTIFHDRVYHPTDIPPPPLKKRTTMLTKKKTKGSASPSPSSTTSLSPSPSNPLTPAPSFAMTSMSDASLPNLGETTNTNTNTNTSQGSNVDAANMRVEEKIARGYHQDLSWRKVLVKLEPDAHNNIMVRRMFPNSYGWPVIRHLVDAHFSDSAVARMRDDDEVLTERALDINQPPGEHGEETKKVSSQQLRGLLVVAATAAAAAGGRGGGISSSTSSSTSPGNGAEPANALEAREALDEVPDLPQRAVDDAQTASRPASASAAGDRADSMSSWSERDWLDSENESDADFLAELARDEERKAGKDRDRDRDGPGWNWAEKIVGKGATKGRGQGLAGASGSSSASTASTATARRD